jgi:hypothetical protein
VIMHERQVNCLIKSDHGRALRVNRRRE